MKTETTSLRLPRGSLLRLDGRQTETLTCLSGVCWLTREDDPLDYVLPAGESLTLGVPGLVVVEALASLALLVVSAPQAIHHAS